MVVGITLLVVAVLAILFFMSAYHTYHGDLPGMFMWAVIFIVVAAVASMLIDGFDIIEIVLGWF